MTNLQELQGKRSRLERRKEGDILMLYLALNWFCLQRKGMGNPPLFKKTFVEDQKPYFKIKIGDNYYSVIVGQVGQERSIIWQHTNH
jgi:hypothetical protein